MTVPAPAARRRATMSDVAALAGVSIKSVSRVVNAEDGVSSQLLARVERAVQALDYSHNLAASNLRRGSSSSSVGLLLEDLSNAFSARLLRTIEDRTRPRGMAVLSASLDDEGEREAQLAIGLMARRVDALVIMAAAADQSYLQSEIRAGLHVVAVDRPVRGVDVDTVVSDNAGGARAATLHLLAQGHTRIACLSDREFLWTAAERARSFRDAVIESAGALDDGLMIGGINNAERAEGVVHQLMALARPPTAIFAAQNEITVGAIRALAELGLRDQVALVGFDDFPMADMMRPGITVVRQDVRRIGELVGELVLARLDGTGRSATRTVVPATLITRGSGEISPLPAR